MKWKVGSRHDEASDSSPKFQKGESFPDGSRTIHSLEPKFSRDLRIPVANKDVVELTFTLNDPTPARRSSTRTK